MQIYKCEKCGKQISGFECHLVYSFSKSIAVDLCTSCLIKHDNALEKADEKFFKKGSK